MKSFKKLKTHKNTARKNWLHYLLHMAILSTRLRMMKYFLLTVEGGTLSKLWSHIFTFGSQTALGLPSERDTCKINDEWKGKPESLILIWLLLLTFKTYYRQ